MRCLVMKECTAWYKSQVRKMLSSQSVYKLAVRPLGAASTDWFAVKVIDPCS